MRATWPSKVLGASGEVEADVARAGGAVVEAAAEGDSPPGEEDRGGLVAEAETGAVEPGEIRRLGWSPGHVWKVAREVLPQLVAVRIELGDHRVEPRIAIVERRLGGDHPEQPSVLV